MDFVDIAIYIDYERGNTTVNNSIYKLMDFFINVGYCFLSAECVYRSMCNLCAKTTINVKIRKIYKYFLNIRRSYLHV